MERVLSAGEWGNRNRLAAGEGRMVKRNEQTLKDRLRSALERTQRYFFRTQHPEGYWWGELESNPTMEAEYIMLTHFLGRTRGTASRALPRTSDDGSRPTAHGACTTALRGT